MTSMVYHAGALGDFITTLPAMAVWRRLHEGERVVLLGKPAFARLIAPAAPVFDEVRDAESAFFAPLFSKDTPLAADLVELFSRVTSALVFANVSSPLAERLGACGVRSIMRQDPFPRIPTPIVDYHLSLFPQFSFSEEERVPRVDAAGGALRPDGTTVAIHPGSGSSLKNWALARFMELAQSLREDGERVTWIVGPAEAEMPLPSGARRWSGLHLRDLAGALSRCRLYVGNDSGVTHLAAACGCPTIVLFGVTDQRVWLPRGRMVRAMTSGSTHMDMIATDAVLRECRMILAR
jgi:ADP-heptose:LPS heptosyltransferase